MRELQKTPRAPAVADCAGRSSEGAWVLLLWAEGRERTSHNCAEVDEFDEWAEAGALSAHGPVSGLSAAYCALPAFEVLSSNIARSSATQGRRNYRAVSG